MVLVKFTTFPITCHYFYFIHFGKFVYFAEFYLVQHERPNIVTESVRIQFVGFECDTGLDPLAESIVDAFIKLQQNFKSQTRCDLAVLKKMKVSRSSKELSMFITCINSSRLSCKVLPKVVLRYS